MPIDNLTALILGLDWDSNKETIQIHPGVLVGRMADSKAEEEYYRLCTEARIEEEGEPFDYAVFASFDEKAMPEHVIRYGDPYALVDRFCNTLAIAFARPMLIVRILIPTHPSSRLPETELLFSYGGQSDFIARGSPTFTDQSALILAQIWQTAVHFWHRDKASGRLNNALTYFYYAWHSPYMEQVCINLSVCLELLFAPHAQAEASHQLAYNVAQFHGGSPDQKALLYDQIRHFYSSRSAIVHGGHPDDTKVIDTTSWAFGFTADVLRRILSDPELAETFNSDEKRRFLLRTYLFNE
jgi:hypothetical protein